VRRRVLAPSDRRRRSTHRVRPLAGSDSGDRANSGQRRLGGAGGRGRVTHPGTARSGAVRGRGGRTSHGPGGARPDRAREPLTPASGPAGSLRNVRVDVLTIFPGLFESPLRQSLLGTAIGAGLLG